MVVREFPHPVDMPDGYIVPPVFAFYRAMIFAYLRGAGSDTSPMPLDSSLEKQIRGTTPYAHQRLAIHPT
jgi:hypothetical protein